MRFRLRTLLIVLTIGPPIIWGLVQFQRWRDKQLWHSFDTAKRERDGLLVEWRNAYELVESGQVSSADEAALRDRYFSARQEVEASRTAIKARYGESDAELLKARQAYLKSK